MNIQHWRKNTCLISFGSYDLVGIEYDPNHNPGNWQDYLEQPIPVERWNDLLMETLVLPNDRYEKSFFEGYTYAESKYITRGSAVAGMVKLLHAAELVRGRDATE